MAKNVPKIGIIIALLHDYFIGRPAYIALFFKSYTKTQSFNI